MYEEGAQFEWYDYLAFCVMLIVSVAIGSYFGFWKKQNTKDEYLFGEKSMAILPVTVSLITSSISGITIMTYPADVYKYGSITLWLALMLPVCGIVYAYVFLPVLIKAEVTNLYGYFEKRLSSTCRILTSVIFTVMVVFYGPVVIYVPSLAFKQATGVDVLIVAPVISAICLFYTAIGGIKAVIWTDTFQFTGTVLSTLLITIIGIISVGGIETVWNTSMAGQRLDIFNFRFDATARDTFWSMIFGATIHWSCFTITNQAEFQKCQSVSTLKKAQFCVVLYGFGVGALVFLTVVNGNIMYTKYSKCDPLSTRQVYRDDQLLPYYVLDTSREIPGLPGIFIAGIFCAALSTYSVVLNAVAGVIYEDYLKRFLSPEKQKNREGAILKTIVCYGVVSTLLVLLVQSLSEIVPFMITVQAIGKGCILGLMILGVLVPVANSKGAICGAIVALVLMSWIGFGRLWYSLEGTLRDASKPMS